MFFLCWRHNFDVWASKCRRCVICVKTLIDVLTQSPLLTAVSDGVLSDERGGGERGARLAREVHLAAVRADRARFAHDALWCEVGVDEAGLTHCRHKPRVMCLSPCPICVSAWGVLVVRFALPPIRNRRILLTNVR